MDYKQDEGIPSELVIGLIGPIGCNRELVISTIDDLAKHFSYSVSLIKVSNLIRKVQKVRECDESDQYERVMALMDAGNELRSDTGDYSILGKLSAVEISSLRPKSAEENRTIYLVDSLKHPDEIKVLRDIYRDGFYLFAIHSDEQNRDKFLQNHCNVSEEANRRHLIDRDKSEEMGWGQNTSSAFHLADFFLAEDGDNRKVWNSLERFFDLIFGDPFRTPTFNEYSMFMAHAASIRSADLSRQVGAVITRDKDIVSSGANECPSPFGGTYWPVFDSNESKVVDTPEGRDYTRGSDFNAQEKDRIVEKIKQDISGAALDQLSKNIRASGIEDLTEYGRVVHAEMDAILGCSRLGISTQNAVMYATTFPCHNCAKHIVASGISQVWYIEPYPKSKALTMHTDSISSDRDDADKRVIFKPFIGVGPRQYINMFSLHLSSGRELKRKQKPGYEKLEWVRLGATPRVRMIAASYRDIENHLSVEIEKQFKVDPT
jgi:deoxycytidylate deaminase